MPVPYKEDPILLIDIDLTGEVNYIIFLFTSAIILIYCCLLCLIICGRNVKVNNTKF